MKKNIFTRIIAIALVAMSIMAVAIPAMALSGSYKPYLGGTGSSYNIRRGHTGDQVKNLQMLLNAYYPNLGLTLDGIFGSATEDAVESFQSEVFGNDGVDGIVGPQTKSALWNAVNVWPNLIVVYPQFQ